MHICSPACSRLRWATLGTPGSSFPKHTQVSIPGPAPAAPSQARKTFGRWGRPPHPVPGAWHCLTQPGTLVEAGADDTTLWSCASITPISALHAGLQGGSQEWTGGPSRLRPGSSVPLSCRLCPNLELLEGMLVPGTGPSTQ